MPPAAIAPVIVPSLSLNTVPADVTLPADDRPVQHAAPVPTLRMPPLRPSLPRRVRPVPEFRTAAKPPALLRTWPRSSTRKLRLAWMFTPTTTV